MRGYVSAVINHAPAEYQPALHRFFADRVAGREALEAAGGELWEVFKAAVTRFGTCMSAAIRLAQSYLHW